MIRRRIPINIYIMPFPSNPVIIRKVWMETAGQLIWERSKRRQRWTIGRQMRQ